MMSDDVIHNGKHNTLFVCLQVVCDEDDTILVISAKC